MIFRLDQILGFFSVHSGTATAFSSSHFGQGQGAIAVRRMDCRGPEPRLSQCNITWTNVFPTCTHMHEAGVSCRGSEFFLHHNGQAGWFVMAVDRWMDKERRWKDDWTHTRLGMREKVIEKMGVRDRERGKELLERDRVSQHAILAMSVCVSFCLCVRV